MKRPITRILGAPFHAHMWRLYVNIFGMETIDVCVRDGDEAVAEILAGKSHIDILKIDI